MGIRVSNISQQIGALGRHLTREQRRAWDAGFGKMAEEMGHVLEQKMAECFARQAEPDGTRWAPMSPLTKALRSATQKRALMSTSTTLGGEILPRSFMLGGRGNVFKVTKKGFTYGSNLKHGRWVVGRTFAEDYLIPSVVDRKAIMQEALHSAKMGGAKKVRAAERKYASKAARVRAYMGAMTGIYAPAAGNQLHHPARPLIYWTPKWEEALTKVATRALTLSLQQAASTAQQAVDRVRLTQADVAAAQRIYDAGHRTSEVG